MYLRIRKLVDRAVLSSADLAAPLINAGRAVVRNRKRRIALQAAGGILAFLVIAVIAAGLLGPERERGRGEPEAWRYLVVCDACGERQRVTARLDRRAAQRCDHCGKGRLSSYRRGSQALIPGGWSASQPAATTRDAEEGS